LRSSPVWGVRDTRLPHNQPKPSYLLKKKTKKMKE
jgi:hypothetical protein